MDTTTIRYRAYANDEDSAFEQALRVVDSAFAIFSSKRIRKVRSQHAWDVDFDVTRRHDGRPITDTFVITVVR